MVETGCDVLCKDACRELTGRRVGVLANPASVNSDLIHVSDVLAGCGVHLTCLFGPQHGYRGETQANMIEWESYVHPRLGIPVYSLYGERRMPGGSMLEGIDAVVIDLPDVGARPYTYLWTAVLMMRACAASGIGIVVLDRPNPINGSMIEGPLLEEGYRSFVGLCRVPMRHSLTLAEALLMINDSERTGCRVEVVRMQGWRRPMFFDDTGLPWVPPSPNVPTPETALAYPATVLLEATNISEGRGTTRPFEIIGAPWIEADEFARELARRSPAGIVFRPVHFQPTWDKYHGETCGGVQLHILERERFLPVRTGAIIIATAYALYGGSFDWKSPPYEYEYELPPIDILAGGPALRETIESGADLTDLFAAWRTDEEQFRQQILPYRLY